MYIFIESKNLLKKKGIKENDDFSFSTMILVIPQNTLCYWPSLEKYNCLNGSSGGEIQPFFLRVSSNW